MNEMVSGLLAGMAWPSALAIAWLAGELGYRWLRLPRISSYAIAGFAMAASQGGFLPNPSGHPIARLADFAFSLILFELGYRINLGWLRANPWLSVTSVVEAAATFCVVLWVARLFGAPPVPALLLSTLSIATSPAAVLRVVNEVRSSGQVTERVLHLSALNCALAVVAFKAVIGYSMLASSGNVFHASWSSVVVVLVSAGLGALFGVGVPALLRSAGGLVASATIAFALATLLLTTLTHELQFSPLLSALTFGLVARHRRIVLTQAQRNFGALGDLLTVVLFVFVAATVDWKHVVTGIDLALAVFAARMAAKTLAATAFARLSATTWRKGFLSGIGLAPMSVFTILLLEQTRYLNLGVLDELAGVAAIVLLLEVAGPLLTHWALIWAGEAHHREET
jgi:Kef-type K+ transport system membrane component KefB